MSWKQWDIGEVVEAGDLQTYIQDQVVQTYPDAAARGSALGTAVSEGMVAYTSDNDTLAVYNGSQWGQVSQAISPNYIINGAFDIWQRGTSFSNPANATFQADRFLFRQNGSGATRTITQQAFTPADLSVLGFGEAPYFFRIDTTVAPTGQTSLQLETTIEDVRTLAGQTAVWSFWAKADQDITFDAQARQRFGSGGSAGDVAFATVSGTITTSWQRFTATSAVPSITGKTIGTGSHVRWQVVFTGAYNTTSTIDIWGVQLEAGSVATPFRRHAPSLQGELAACARYYERIALGRVSATTSGNSTVMSLPYMTRKRSTPSVSSNATNANYASVWQFSQSGVTLSSKSGTATINFDGSDGSLNHLQINIFGATYSPTPNTLESISGLYFEASAEL